MSAFTFDLYIAHSVGPDGGVTDRFGGVCTFPSGRKAPPPGSSFFAVILYVTMELIFEVRDADEGGYVAHALGHAIFTEAETWDELRSDALESTLLHFEDAPVQPRSVQLHSVKDELIPLEAA